MMGSSATSAVEAWVRYAKDNETNWRIDRRGNAVEWVKATSRIIGEAVLTGRNAADTAFTEVTGADKIPGSSVVGIRTTKQIRAFKKKDPYVYNPAKKSAKVAVGSLAAAGGMTLAGVGGTAVNPADLTVLANKPVGVLLFSGAYGGALSSDLSDPADVVLGAGEGMLFAGLIARLTGLDIKEPGAPDMGPAPERKPIDSTRSQHGSPGHHTKGMSEARKMSGRWGAVETRYNQKLIGPENRKAGELQPDVQTIRNKWFGFGRKVVDVTEIRSDSQSPAFMDRKVERYKRILGRDAGKIQWKERDPDM